MLEYIEDFKKFIEITGFRNVKINNKDIFMKNIRKGVTNNVAVQVFNAKNIATWQHLYFAVLNSLTSFKNKLNFSRSLAIEIILYASGQSQICKAIELFGVNPENREIAVVLIADQIKEIEKNIKKISESLCSKKDDNVLDLTEYKIHNIKKMFNISDLELNVIIENNDLNTALINIVIEKMAILSTQC